MLIFVVGCGQPQEQSNNEEPSEKTQFTIAAGVTGSPWHAIAVGIGETIKRAIPEADITIISGGAISNIELIERGEIDLALSSGCLVYTATRGEDPFEQKYENVKSISKLYPAAMQYAVTASSGIASFNDVKEKEFPLKISIGPQGALTEWATKNMLLEYGITYEDIRNWGGSVQFLDNTDAVNQIRDGLIHALAGHTSRPAGYITEVTSDRDMVILPVEESVINAMINKYGFEYQPVPGGIYKNNPNEIPTYGTTTNLIVNGNIPEETVYKITKSFYENRDYLINVHHELSAIDKESWDVGSPLHLGAEKYWKEIGAMD